MRSKGLFGATRGAAAAEMALITPLMLTIFLGSVELGNYLYNEHLLEKAVRDGARYAARQNFSYYQDGSGNCASPTDATMIANVKTLVKTSLLTGGTSRMGNWNDSTINISAACYATADDLGGGTENMTGIYTGRSDGAPVVTVSATVPYTSVIGTAFGFSGKGLNLNASDQAAVMGI